MKRKTCKTILTLLALVGGTQWAAAQGTAFTFQGLLTGQVVPSEGTCDLRFALFDAASGGGAVGSPLTNAAVGVTNGLFTTMLDFGAGAFTGPARWLEIAVRTNGAAAFAVLAPRQPLTPAPYAIFAGGVNAAGIVGTISATNIGAGTITSASLDPNVGVWSRSGANVFYIGGNVGIGMSAPTNALQVVGNVTVEGAETIELRANHVTLGQTNVANGSGATAMGITTRASGGGATAMGGLTTASGVYSTAMGLLTAASGSGSTAMGISSRASGLGSLAAGDQANAIHDGSFVWADLQNTEFASTSTNQFLIRAAGGVGINTTTPATALHVNGAATVSGVGSFVARTAAALVLSNTTANTGRTWEWHALDDGRLQLVDVKAGSSGTRMMVAANGYVGIGTTTPSERLHVVGNIAAVGDIHATGNVGINTTNPATALHVNGNTVLEGGFTPSSATASNLLNLAVGLNANGALNGISFYESSGAAAMSLGYDGLVHNALRIYDNAGGAPVSFLQGGNVGIGTIDPVAHFTVAGSGNYIDPGAAAIVLENTTPATGRRWEWHALDNGPMQLADQTAGKSRLLIDANGNIGIGTATPLFPLHIRGNAAGSPNLGLQMRLENSVNGQAWDIGCADLSPDLCFTLANSLTLAYISYTDGSYHNGSDARLKKDIAPVGPVLDRVLQLRPVAFRLKSSGDDVPKSLGFLAQEVEPLFPETVSETRGIKYLAYSELIPVTIGALQELHGQVQVQDAEVRELQKKANRVDELEKRVADLEQLVNSLTHKP